MPVDTGTAKFELTLSLEDEADGALAGVLEFAADLFLPATVERLAEGYARLLHGVAAMPATSLRELLAASGLDRAAGVRVVEAVTAPSAVVPPPVVLCPASPHAAKRTVTEHRSAMNGAYRSRERLERDVIESLRG